MNGTTEMQPLRTAQLVITQSSFLLKEPFGVFLSSKCVNFGLELRVNQELVVGVATNELPYRWCDTLSSSGAKKRLRGGIWIRRLEPAREDWSRAGSKPRDRGDIR